MRPFIAGLLIVLAAGPAYPQSKEYLQLQADMINAQQLIRALQKSVDENNAVVKGLVEKIADQVNTLAGGLQKMTQAVDGVKAQNDTTMSGMRTTLTALNATMKELQDEVAGVRTQMGSITKELREAKTTAEPLAGPNDIWRTAYADYSSGQYDLAIDGYREFLEKFPTEPRAAEAHLQIANALAAQNKFDAAVDEYDIVLQKYPENDKSRSALLKKGLAQAKTAQPQQAVATLNEVVKKFPNTSEAATAQAALKELQPAARRTPAPNR